MQAWQAAPSSTTGDGGVPNVQTNLKYGFILIQRVLLKLEDDQDKLKQAEVITCRAFQDAVEKEGYPRMTQSLRDLALTSVPEAGQLAGSVGDNQVRTK